jgi:SAM-dependent methyltransferase
MGTDPLAAGAPQVPVQPTEKVGLRNAWGRVAVAYDELWAERTAHLTARGLDLLAPEADWDGCDIACGPGLTARALAERLPQGRTLGLDYAETMVARASARHAGPGLSFAIDDAERLEQPSGAFGAVTCSFGLMYCYEPHSALRHMARVLQPGGRLMLMVWGRASRVWWSPVIDLVESRAAYYVSICPMMFFYGLPGVLARMVADVGLEVIHDELIDGRMGFPSSDVAAEAAIMGAALAGLFTNRLDAAQQQEVRQAMTSHISGSAEPDGGGIALPAQVAIVVAQRGDARQ